MPIKLPKGCTNERAEEIQTWAYMVWEIHWKKFAPVSNSRADFLKYCIRDHDVLDVELMKKIELAVKAYTKYLYAKVKAGDKLVGVKTLSVWYNKSCYEDQFIDESAADLKSRTELQTCSVDGCTNPVHGPRFRFCTDHVPNTSVERLRNAYRKTVGQEVPA